MRDALSNRYRRILRFAYLLLLSWCTMTFVHEAGHVLCGWVSGGTLQQADLLPWHLPFSIFEPDPHPLFTLWGGPVLGVLIPWLVACLLRMKWAWFVAHFCLLANGSYIACAWFSGERLLDTARLLEHGAYPASIATYCAITITLGYIGFRRSCIELLSPVTKCDDRDQNP